MKWVNIKGDWYKVPTRPAGVNAKVANARHRVVSPKSVANARQAPFTSWRWASRYFSAVLATTSAGSSGAGGFLFQPMCSR